jgi:hypothetical protein
MDNADLVARIESGQLRTECELDGFRVSVEVEAVDQLGLLLKRIELKAPRNGVLLNQARAVVEKVTYLGGALKVIEVDGVSNAAQIRSSVPENDGYVEVVLRGGNRLSLERRPEGSLHLSKDKFKRLVEDLCGALGK